MNHKALFVGLTTIDIQYFINDFPEPNTKIKTDQPGVLVGGPATNAAVAFAYLNGTVTLASPTGQNAFSSFISRDFTEYQIKHYDLAKDQNFDPVLASVLTSPNGDRTIITHNPNDINSSVSAEELIANVNPDILLIDGFYPEFAAECALICKERLIPVVADCGSWKPQFEVLLDSVDIAICSADFLPPFCQTRNELVDYLQRKKVKCSAVSNGGDAIEYFHDGAIGKTIIQNTIVKDTLGAGDFLHGAFCYYFLEVSDFRLALQKAAELASFTCRFKGTREWLNFDHNALLVENNP